MSGSIKNENDTASFVHQSHPEIIIGLVSPLGVDLDTVCAELQATLINVDYKPIIIKLSATLDETKDIHGIELDSSCEDKRYATYMDAGNALRQKMERMDALALLGIARIKAHRQEQNGDPNQSISKTAYILRSLKNKKEIETLKNVYGQSFFLISAYSPRERRKNNLTKKIAESHNKPSQTHLFKAEAEKLIERDLSEEGEKFGQEVSKAFPLADLFIEVDHTREKIQKSIERFIKIVFGYPFHTPTKDEFGMFLAFSSALRSADLSRQVGAAITNLDGDLLSIGCNEVPKFEGGQYWEDDDLNKARDFEIGFDSSAYMKKEVLAETISFLQQKGIEVIDNKADAHDITNELLYGKHSDAFKSADIANLLEYGRMVHAEMAAITEAAKRGVILKGSTLFCTTFPCHMCARHIVASGIKRVVYVEPYPKSKAEDLYKDSIAVDPDKPPSDKVAFEPFVGISPSRFHDLFKYLKRKDGYGKKEEWSFKDAKPRIKIFNDSYIISETDCIAVAGQIIEKLRIKKQ